MSMSRPSQPEVRPSGEETFANPSDQGGEATPVSEADAAAAALRARDTTIIKLGNVRISHHEHGYSKDNTPTVSAVVGRLVQEGESA